MQLGAGKLSSLSIGFAGMDHNVCHQLSLQLHDASAPSLLKLTIEGEHGFADRGAVQLLKHLQFNSTLKYLCLRDCMLTRRSAVAFSRYLGVSRSLEVAVFNDNLFTYGDMVTVMRAVGNKGSKGCFRSVSLIHQNFAVLDEPTRRLELTPEQKLELYHSSIALGVRLECEGLPIEEAVRLDRARDDAGAGADARELAGIGKLVKEFARLGVLDDALTAVISKKVFV